MIRSWCILIFNIVCCIATAQISGTVVDKSTNEGLLEAEVIELSSGARAITDETGYFYFDINKDDATQFIIFKEGFEIYEYLIGSVEDQYIIALDKLSVELSEVEFVRKRQEIFATRKLKDIEGTTIYAGKKTEVVLLDLINANKAANLSRQVYAQISGLNIYESSNGGLQLNIGGRGLDPNRTSNFNTRQNGYDISADVLGYPENYYTPPAEALDEIRILRGASSLQYGTQFGGLIDFRIRKIPAFRKWDIRTKQTYGSFNFFNSYNSIGYNSGKWSIDAFYNYKRGDGYRQDSEFNSNNLFIATRYAFSDKTHLDVEFTYFNYLAKQAGGLTDTQFDLNPRMSTRNRNWFDVNWKLYSVKFQHSFTEKQKLDINLFGLNASRRSVGFRGDPSVLNANPITSIDEQDNNGNFINPRDIINGQFKNIGAEIKFLSDYNLRNVKATYVIGAKYYDSNNTAVQGPGSTGTDADFSLQTIQFPDYANQSDFVFPNLNYAAFLENIFFINDKLSITPGLRLEFIETRSEGTFQEVVFDLAGNPIANTVFEDNENFRRSFLLLGVGVDYKLSDYAKYSINLTQNYRSVTFSDIRVVSPSFIVDEDITDERGVSFNTGISGRIKSKFSYDFNLYSILYNERIGIILDDRANRVRTNIGDALILGTESLINYIPLRIVKKGEKVLEIKSFLNTAFTYSRYLNSLSNNVVGNGVEFIPTINVKSGVSLRYKNFNWSVQHSYVSKQFTDAQNSLATSDGDFRSGIVGEIPAYQILDVNFGYSFSKFSLEAGINNALNAQYYTQRATGYPGPGIIPSDGRSFYATVSYIFQK